MNDRPQAELSSRPPPWLRMLLRKDALTGLMLMAFAALGLWLSRDYPMGTTLRMGTGYVPRLLCWVLLALGGLILVQGLLASVPRQESSPGAAATWRPVIFVTASLVAFGLSLERLGLVVAITLLIGVGALAARGLRLVETIAAAVVLIVLSWAIFILGLGITIPVWPEF
jgi:putative tricarboxylic transport membrane protein